MCDSGMLFSVCVFTLDALCPRDKPVVNATAAYGPSTNWPETIYFTGDWCAWSPTCAAVTWNNFTCSYQLRITGLSAGQHYYQAGMHLRVSSIAVFLLMLCALFI